MLVLWRAVLGRRALVVLRIVHDFDGIGGARIGRYIGGTSVGRVRVSIKTLYKEEEERTSLSVEQQLIERASKGSDILGVVETSVVRPVQGSSGRTKGVAELRLKV